MKSLRTRTVILLNEVAVHDSVILHNQYLFADCVTSKVGDAVYIRATGRTVGDLGQLALKGES
jgi:hypothetical protein